MNKIIVYHMNLLRNINKLFNKKNKIKNFLNDYKKNNKN